jgi:glycerophosphoryl diester phosphodiesterase
VCATCAVLMRCILGSGDSDSLGLHSLSGSVDTPMIRELRDAGLLVHAWTENDPERVRALIEPGVTGIVTDYPNRLSRVLDPSWTRR